MSETKIMNDVFSIKSTKSKLVTESLKSVNMEESEIDNDNNSQVDYDKTIENIVTSTSGIIDNVSVINNTPKILNSSISPEKLEAISISRDMLKERLLKVNQEEKPSIVVEAEPNISVKAGKVFSKYNSIENLNTTIVLDTTDTNTISNEVMALSEVDDVSISKANSEISETTLNQSQLFNVSSILIDKPFRLSTNELELPKSYPSSITYSPTSPSSLILSTPRNPIIHPSHSYSADNLFEDRSSLLKSKFSLYSNYSFASENSMSDDFDSESTTVKKKKSVRFSNIVDVIDSDQKDTLDGIGTLDTSKNNQMNSFSDTSVVINVDDNEEDVNESNGTNLMNTRTEITHGSCAMKIKEVVTIFFSYLFYILNNILGVFKVNKKNKKSNIYRNVRGNNMFNFNSSFQEIVSDEEDTFSQNSTIDNSNESCLIDQVEGKKAPIEHIIVESEVVNYIPMSLKESSTYSLDSFPITINSLSQKKGNRVVHYWYNDNKKTMAQRFGLSKGSQSPNKLKNNINETNSNTKQGNKFENIKHHVSLGKNKETNLESSTKIKRSSLINFKPTNIDINNIPNISATTTTNTILNSSSPFREEKNQIANKKGIIIRDLNADGELYEINLNNISNEKFDISTSQSNDETKILCLASSPSFNNEKNNTIEKEERNIDVTPSSSIPNNKESPKKSSKKFGHRRQNSVRLEISY